MSEQERTFGYIVGHHQRQQEYSTSREEGKGEIPWVEIEYELPTKGLFPYSYDLDTALDKLALRLGGSPEDSGTGFGVRDLSYSFSNGKEDTFAAAAELVLTKHKIKGWVTVRSQDT